MAEHPKDGSVNGGFETDEQVPTSTEDQNQSAEFEKSNDRIDNVLNAVEDDKDVSDIGSEGKRETLPLNGSQADPSKNEDIPDGHSPRTSVTTEIANSGFDTDEQMPTSTEDQNKAAEFEKSKDKIDTDINTADVDKNESDCGSQDKMETPPLNYPKANLSKDEDISDEHSPRESTTTEIKSGITENNADSVDNENNSPETEAVVVDAELKEDTTQNTDKIDINKETNLVEKMNSSSLDKPDSLPYTNGNLNESLDINGKKLLDMDRLLVIVGEFGIFQKIVNAMYCIMAIPGVFNLVLMEFVAYNPPWKCISGSSMCVWNGTFESTNRLRCNVPRNEWMYTVPKEASLVTHFDINCNNEWLISLTSSILFAGWIIGSFILGWLADKYGRKIVIFGSLVIILTVGFVSTFSPNIHVFIACRFIIGIFTAGSYPNMIVSITEIVGIKRRPLASLMVCLFLSVGLAILGVKAYLIRDWKYLNIACTAPYLLLLLFYKFVPESIRYLILKRRTDDAMTILHNIARWNKKEIPADVAIAPIVVPKSKRSAGPFDLVRSRSLLCQNFILAFSWFAIGASDIGLFLAADDFGGDMYRDFILLTLTEIPFGVLAMYVLEKFGRKRTVSVSVFLSSLNFAVLCFIPKAGPARIARIVIALVIKAFVVIALNSMYTWTVEIYPTKLRGMAMGMAQVMNGIGSGSSPWFVHELKNIRMFAPYVTLGIVMFLSGCLLCLLPESKGVPLTESKRKKPIGDNELSDFRNGV